MLNLSLTADDRSQAQALALIEQAGALANELVPGRPPLLETVLGGKPDNWDKQKAGMAGRLRLGEDSREDEDLDRPQGTRW
jgi:hypothetical protein